MTAIMLAQRKIQVVFNLGQKNGYISGRLLEKPASGQKNGLIYGLHRRKAGGSNPWAHLADCFEEQADVFASCGAMHYAKILASLKMKFILPSHLVRLSFKTRICCARCKSTACRSG